MVSTEPREAWNWMICPDMACGSVIAQLGPDQCDPFNFAYISTVLALMGYAVQRDVAVCLCLTQPSKHTVGEAQITGQPVSKQAEN